MTLLIQQSEPSWKGGFARSIGESAFPSLRKGLVGAWIPSLGPTGLTLKDVSGFGNDGVLTNMATDDWVVGEKGYALDYDGVDEYVDLGTSWDKLNGVGALSFSVWIKSSVASFSGFDGIIGIGDSGDRPLWLYGKSTTSSIIWHSGTTTTQQDININAGVVVQNVWTCFSGTWDGVNGTLYQDGQVIGVDTSNGNVLKTLTNEPRRIGDIGGIATFDGEIGSLLIWNRWLSPNEIQKLYIDPMAPFRRRQVFGYVSGATAGGLLRINMSGGMNQLTGGMNS